MRAVDASPVDEQYLLARLHGMWSKAAQGERLQKLVHSTTPEILRENLREYHLDGQSREAFYQSLLERRQEQLRLLQRISTIATRGLYEAMLCRPWYENMKTALHAVVSPQERRKEFAAILLKTEDVPALDLERGPRAWTLPPGLTHHDLERAQSMLHRHDDFLEADTFLDKKYLSLLQQRARKCPAEFREAFEELLAQHIDVLNICSLLRNLRTYHLPAERMEELWLEGGEHLTPLHLSSLNAKQNYAEAISALPSHYRHAFPDGADTALWEERLWNGVYASAKRVFMDFTHPLYSLATYPMLLRFETLNLGRVFEGVHFAIPAEQMMTMLTGA